jgi:Ca2+-binding EF-hand superfamily protein
MSFRKIKADFSIPITTFPESLHPLLKEIDGPDGNGSLETDELTEVFEMYAAAKKANEEGCIALKSLPQDLQKTLQVFDVDGDGTVGTAELARAAELYQDSKNMVKRLAKAVAVLFLVMVALVGTIVGLTAHVIESAKETETSGDGITYVKGSDQPTATGRVTSYDTLSESYAFSPEALDDVDTAYLFSDDETEEFSYSISGWSRNVSHLIFYTSRGDTITVDTVGNLITHDDAGNVLLEKEGEGSGRRLLRRGKASTIRRGGSQMLESASTSGWGGFQGNF